LRELHLLLDARYVSEVVAEPSEDRNIGNRSRELGFVPQGLAVYDYLLLF
jgi:hypothetical protein